MSTSNLTASFPGDAASLYVILRRVTDAKVWDVANTTWATWVDGNIDDYDVALTAKGGDLYQAAFPTDIATGTFVKAYFYEQAGASPAVDDLLLKSPEYVWNGSTLDSESSVALLPYALTTLAAIKRKLGISQSDTSQDTYLTELINAATEKIERYTGRRFAATNYVEWLDINGENELKLDQYPVIQLNAVGLGVKDALRVTYTGSAISAGLEVKPDGILLTTMSVTGAISADTIAWADYETVSEVATQIGLVSGWSATSVENGPAKHLRPTTVGLDSGVPASLVSADDYTFDWSVDRPAGTLRASGQAGGVYPFGGGAVRLTPTFGHGANLVMADYRAGYETIPDDIAQLCRDFAGQLYHLGSKDTSLTSESLGSYSYSLADSTSLNESAVTVLARYAEAVVA